MNAFLLAFERMADIVQTTKKRFCVNIVACLTWCTPHYWAKCISFLSFYILPLRIGIVESPYFPDALNPAIRNFSYLLCLLVCFLLLFHLSPEISSFSSLCTSTHNLGLFRLWNTPFFLLIATCGFFCFKIIFSGDYLQFTIHLCSRLSRLAEALRRLQIL